MYPKGLMKEHSSFPCSGYFREKSKKIAKYGDFLEYWQYTVIVNTGSS